MCRTTSARLAPCKRAKRQGLGGRLLEPVLEIAERDQVECYLETVDPRNAEYYARHGFVVENPGP